MRNRGWFLVLILYASVFVFQKPTAKPEASGELLHIVYLGEKKQHHDLLATILGSKKKASKATVYSYKHAFSGFAAKLTKSQAHQLAEIPGVLRVLPNVLYDLHTTRSWDFLGVSPSPYSPNLLHSSNLGDGIIIGIIDSGIWPESEAFNDDGLGPVPRRWRGTCKSGEKFNASRNCNRKIIGARWYVDGFKAEFGEFNRSSATEFISPRDSNGHGTQTASTAAGSFVSNVSYRGLAGGTLRGGAPRARLAMYKACWSLPSGGGQCAAADVLKALDDAVQDRVDVLSLSLGKSVPLFPEVDEENVVAIGSFHAISRNIPVVCSAGNDGPSSETVLNTSPWILNVAASSMDRTFLATIVLGNNNTFLGQTLFSGEEIGYSGLVYPGSGLRQEVAGLCELVPLVNGSKWMAGKVVLCFSRAVAMNPIAISRAAEAVKAGNGVGLIVARHPDDIWFACADDFPCFLVDLEIGSKIFYYIRATSSPLVRLGRSRTITGNPISAHIAYFSSRGPNSVAPAILKPDVAAPGVAILAATSPLDPTNDRGFTIQTGTSIATPHVSAIVALLKSLHPTWSPAAIKSAIVTTAWNTHSSSGVPILTEGSPWKRGDPFDYGGGIVNPNAAANPGLIYDMATADYISYFCSMGYNNSAISVLTQDKTECPTQDQISILDLNLPSITVPALSNWNTVTRTVTNVGNLTSVYRVVIDPPIGTRVEVEPPVLAFNATVRKLSFKVTIWSLLEMDYGFSFGSIIWSDGVHLVQSPLSVRIQIQSPFHLY
ncbi:subtilisin-like protease SBT3.5 isoform X2 [Momordica charantia]|uniref:Subtilisin-like protease SBT3.5 isoform X2 n=1 Tax=Momordica charantia TaxID=3673 RepID=A0A6J1C5D1_MOMCH|nr:subtilisin-like protease SBT3.5 isoform X2 [Momordica charantia]